MGPAAARSGAPVLVYNVSSIVPGDTVYCYAGMDETLATRIRRFNVALSDLSQRTADRGPTPSSRARAAGRFHLNGEGCRLVATEAVRVLDDLGVLPPRVAAR